MSREVLKKIAVVWILCVIVLSLQPVRIPILRDPLSLKHQIQHVLIFGATAMLLLAMARRRVEEFKAVAGVFCLAVVIEVSQFLIYRLPEFEWWDVREDSIGAALALLIHQAWPLVAL